MSRFGSYVVRFALIALGYGVAALATGLFAQLAMLAMVGFDLQRLPWEPFGGFVLAVGLLTLLAGYFAFVPAVLLIAIGEIGGFRRWFYYALSGAGSGLSVALFFVGAAGTVATGIDLDGAGGEPPTVMHPELLVGAAAGGVVAGLAYWLVAGRSAGLWLDRITSPGR